MKKAVRLIALAIAGILLVSTIAGCSAYKNPEKYITVPEKGTVKISQADIDSDYESTIKEILEEYKETPYEKLDDPNATIQKGDTANITYTGVPKSKEIDDEAVIKRMTNADTDGGTDLVIGSNSFIVAYKGETDETSTEGFEDQLIGAKAGETVKVTVTFPDDYSTEVLRGVVAEFTVTVNSISRATVSDKSTISVDYAFALVESEEENNEETETAEVSNPAPAGDSGETTGSDTETTGSDTETTGSDTETTGSDGDTTVDTGLEDDNNSFEDLFTNASFTYDFTDKDQEDIELTPFLKASELVDALKGKSLNDVYEHTFTVPESTDPKYKEYYNKEVKVTLTIKDITVLPELSDEIVDKYTNSEYKTVAEFEKFIKDNTAGDHAFTAIIDATKVNKYPNKETKQIYKNYVNQLVYSKLGKNPSEYTQKELDKLITKEDYEEIYSQATTSALSSVKQRLVMEYFFDYYNIELTNAEYKQKLQDSFNAYASYYIYYYQITDAKALEKQYGKEYFENQFKLDKLLEVISDYVTIE